MGETGRKELRSKWSVDNTPQPCVERTLTGGEKKRAVWKSHQK